MNTYSRALRHINMGDVKQKHQQKLIEERQQRKLEREEKKYIQSVMKEIKYDWRKELNEGMTSSGTFFTTLPATGDDALISVDVGNSSSYAYTSSVFYDGGLSIKSYGSSPGATTNVIDTSTSDSISFVGYANLNFSTQTDLQILWYNNDTGEFGLLTGISKTATSSATYNVTLPSGAKGKNVDFSLFQVRSNSYNDFIGKTISIGNEVETIGSNEAGLIVSILSDTNGTNRVSLGKDIMFNYSNNIVNGIPSFYYPGYTGPVSGNAGDPDIDGSNSHLTTLKTNNSAGFTRGYLSVYTQQQMIDLFIDTDMNAAALYIELGEYGTAFDLANSYYAQYVTYDIAGNTSLANYYLNLSNQQAAIRDTKATEVMSRINSASVLPDSRWTDADFAKVSQDIYDLYNGSFTYNITSLSTKRRSPMNVFVPLDSPEATAFIRTEPNLSDLSPEEKNKKLTEMLNASDEYLEKMLGADFPGTGAVPPGEFDPFAQPAPGEAGDTPGVDIDNWIASDYEKSGTAGYGNPYRIDWGPKPGKPGPGYKYPNDPWDVNDPSTWPSIKNQVKQASDDQNKKKKDSVVVAHYEPQGEVITERKKLKSPEDVLNKIPGYYDGKPAPLGFPVEQPPKMVNGMHPDLVDGKKTADRFNRMDPESAKAMPLTGNPHIDKKVKAARKKPK